MKEKEYDKGTLLFIVILAVIVVGSFGAIVGYALHDNGNNVGSNSQEPTVYNNVTYIMQSNTALLDEIKNITTILNKDEEWAALAIEMAEDDWNTERHIYNALISLNMTDISDRSDIDRVVIKETDVFNDDADDQDANVEQVVRVYYESDSGDDKRIDLLISTEIIDGEVEDVVYELD